MDVMVQNVFNRMEREQDWSEHRVADRIALLYIFLPQVHWEIGKFVRVWNAHTIRAQRNRPHVVPGVPSDNYFGPDTATRVNCAVPVDNEHLARMEEAVAVDRPNITGYLPEEMLELCQAMMATLNGNAMPDVEPDRPFLGQYRHLRDALQRHEDQRSALHLQLAEKPTGGWAALETLLQETGRSLQDILDERFDEDDFDPGLDLP